MQPSLSYPFNVRSFFTNRETKDIGAGLELCKFSAQMFVQPFANI
jgi:hypothetical protein